jgi:hypothetical protein
VTQPATLPATTAEAASAAPVTPAVPAPVYPPDPPAETDPKIIDSDVILAERLASIAELQFAAKVTNPDAWPWIWKHQAAILSASSLLDPRQPRFPRLVADACAQNHDIEGEKTALGRAILAQRGLGGPGDEFAWDRDLDLHLLEYQTADAKLKYLDGLMGVASSESIPADVRAHAGYRMVQIMLEQGKQESAAKKLNESLVLCPRSLECLILKYNLLPPDATRLDRCNQLLDLLRANPLQGRYSAELADLAADSGLVQESLPWFSLAVVSLHLQGDPAAHSMLQWAAEEFIAGEKSTAASLNKLLLKQDPSNTQAHFLDVVIARSLKDSDASTAAIQQAGNALGNRVIEAVAAAAPGHQPQPTTRAITDPDPLTLPDLGPTVAQLNQTGTPAQKQQFAEAVSDMALLEGYFAQQPDIAGKLVDALAGVVPADSPVLARLRGWNLLLANKPDDAKALFAGAAEQDPLAELGLVKIMLTHPEQREEAEKIGRQLIQKHPSGLLGAILWEQLNSERVKLIPPVQADGLQKSLQAFPTELLSLADKPQTIYRLHVEPQTLQLGSYVGEPLLAQVTISNLTGDDLTIGPDGVIKPELIFKVVPQVGKDQSFEAFDTIAGPTVLPPQSQFQQIVRLDQTQLLLFLDQASGHAFGITGTLTSNQVVNRLGGYEVGFYKDFARQTTPLTDGNLRDTLAMASDGRPDLRIRALSTLELYIEELRAMKTPPAGAAQQITNMLEAIGHSARTDPLPAVSTWAAKCQIELADPTQRERMITDMAEDPDWRHRQLAVLMLSAVPEASRSDLLGRLLKDPVSTVRADAAAMQGLLLLPAPPATMPVPEQPATMPAAAPGVESPMPAPVAPPAP